MKKMYIAVFLCVLMLTSIPLTVGEVSKEVKIQSNDTETQSILGIAFIAGLITNPQTTGKYVNAKAIILAYYDFGLLGKDQGIVMGLRNVRFRKSNLLYMSEPDQFGLSQVAGICTGFYVQKLI
jgi:hypothetical protein